MMAAERLWLLTPYTLRWLSMNNMRPKTTTLRTVENLTSKLSKPPVKKPIDIAMIGAVFCKLLSRPKDAQLFSISMKDVNEHLKKTEKKKTDLLKVLFEKYHSFAGIFSKAASDILPPHRNIDHRIILKEDEAGLLPSLYNINWRASCRQEISERWILVKG